MKTSEIREKNAEELDALENDLRDQLIKLQVAKSTQRATNTSQFPRIKRDIARVLTIKQEREMGLGSDENTSTPGESDEPAESDVKGES